MVTVWDVTKSDIHPRAFLATSVCACEQGPLVVNSLTLVTWDVTKSDIHPRAFLATSVCACEQGPRVVNRFTLVDIQG